MHRYGMTVPFDGVPLGEQRDWFEELVDLGYTDAWSSEANGTDAFTRSRWLRCGRHRCDWVAPSPPRTPAGQVSWR